MFSYGTNVNKQDTIVNMFKRISEDKQTIFNVVFNDSMILKFTS